MSWPLRERLTPYAFLAPAMIAIALAYLYPIFEALRMSLHADGIGLQLGRFAGLDQYVDILADQLFLDLLFNSAVYSAGIVIFVWLLGLTTAVMLNRQFPGRALARAMLIVPWAIPLVAAALIWEWIFHFEYGALTYLLSEISGGDRVNFLASCPDALGSVTGVSIWRLYPFGTVMFLGALQTIPRELYEAARVDGAGPIQSFWHVTLPGVRNVSVFLTLLVIIWTFGRAFALIFFLTGGGPAGCSENLVLRTYLEGFKFFNPNRAAAMGMIVLLISLAFSAAYLALLYRREKQS